MTAAYRYAKPGDYLCPDHGLIEPYRGVVPACPTCMQWAFRAEGDGDNLRWRYDSPARCPAGHRLVPGRMLVGWYPCQCAGTGGHNWWTCRAEVEGGECGGKLTWPPCTAEAERFQPGWRHRGHDGKVGSDEPG